MRDEQPPITNDEEYRGYQKARDTMTALLTEREARLFEALESGDGTLIEDRRFELRNTLRQRQGIIDAITASERSRQQTA